MGTRGEGAFLEFIDWTSGSLNNMGRGLVSS
jgi:hypothetical protein